MIYVFFSWSFSRLLHESFFCSFLCFTTAAGPYLVTNRKALILLEQNIDNVFLSLAIRKLSVVVWLRLRERLHIFLKHFYFYKRKSVVNYPVTHTHRNLEILMESLLKESY